jgi:hypothetical protein
MPTTTGSTDRTSLPPRPGGTGPPTDDPIPQHEPVTPPKSEPLTAASCSIPDAPAKPDVAVGDSTVTLSFGPPQDRGCPITGYQYQQTSGSWKSLPSNGVVGGLQNGSQYAFKVRAVSSAGVGAASPWSSTVRPLGRPGAVADLRAVVDQLPSGASRYYWTFRAADPNGATSITHTYEGDGRGNVLHDGTTLRIACYAEGKPCLATPDNLYASIGPSFGDSDRCNATRPVSVKVWASNTAGAGPSTSLQISLPQCPLITLDYIDQPINDMQGWLRWTIDEGGDQARIQRVELNPPFEFDPDPYTIVAPGERTLPVSYMWYDREARVEACNAFGCSTSPWVRIEAS